MNKCLFIFFLLIQFGAWAETSQDEIPYLFIPPVIAPKEFSDFEKQQINKLVVKGSARQTTYQVMIGKPDVTKRFKWQLHQINVSVLKEGDDFVILAQLKDARKEVIINSIQEDHIPELELYRKIEEIIDRLFLPVEKNLDSAIRPKPVRAKSETIVQINEAARANINFRERIMSLKTDVNTAVSKASAIHEKKVLDPPKEDQDLNIVKKTSENKTNTDASLQMGSGNEVLPIKPKAPLPLDIGHSLRAGYYSFNTNSKDNLVDTDSHPKYLLIDYEYARSWFHQSHFYHHVNLRYGKTLNKEEKEFAPYTGAALYEGYFFESLGWLPKLGLEMDTISFKNLPQIGQGLKLANNQIFWFNVSSVNSLKLFSRDFRFSLGYSKPFMIKSSYNGLDNNPALAGSKINLTFAMLNLYKKIHLELNYFKSELTANSPRVIKFNTTGVGFNAFINF